MTENERRLIQGLHPSLRAFAAALLEAAEAEGIYLVITQGARSFGEQSALYAQGRTAPGRIVTYAPPGYSWHNFGLAFDVAVDANPDPLRAKPTWPNDEALWERIGQLGEAVGLEWGGRWLGKKKDRPHFQRTQGITLAEARAGKRPS